MALSLNYINEVLNHVPSTVVVDEQEWPGLLKAFKFEGRKLEDLILGQMRLRWAPGGYEGLMQRLADLTQQRDEVQKALLEKQIEVETLKAHVCAREPEAVAAS